MRWARKSDCEVAGLKDINLFDGIKKSAPPKKSGRSVAAGLILLIACTAAVGGLYFWQSTQKDTLEGEIEAANQQIGTSQSMSTTELTGKQTELASVRSYNAMLLALDENVQAYPKLDAAFLSDLEGRLPAGVSVQTFGYQNGVLSLECTAGDADAPANFADALSKSEYMEAVNLIQSQLNVQMELDTGTVQYVFTVQCYLKGGEAE
jgi:Tfp pilus assembly protein PilN